MLASQGLRDAPPSIAQDPYRAAWDVVLARTSRGEAQVQQPLVRLSRAQAALLAALDGRRSLQLLVARQPELASARLSRDAARLLAFGLVRQVQGELPRELVVAAMNLTLQLPARAATAWAGTDRHGPAAPAAPDAPDRDTLPPQGCATAPEGEFNIDPPSEPDPWLDDDLVPDVTARGVAAPAPGLLHALPYMAATSVATLLLAWLVWR